MTVAMPNTRTAKVMRMGPSSIVVVLPRDWVRGNGIDPGEEVEVSYDGRDVTYRKKVHAPTQEIAP